MIKGAMKRKGDVTISTIILIVLGLVVLVMMILGFTKGWDFIFGNFDNAPSELQTFAKACGVYAQGGLSIDFCNYKLIGNDLVNCRDERVTKSMDADGVNYGSEALKCTDQISDEGQVVACEDTNLVAEAKRGSIKVNGGKSCKEIIDFKVSS